MKEPEIISIPAGDVTLGVPAFPQGTALPHPWSPVTRAVPAFGIAARAVTVGEYLGFAEITGYPIHDTLAVDPRFHDPLAPAGFVSWIDATSYVQWLARETGKPYRLVRDAEYEYAARGRMTGKRFPWGDDVPDGLADFGNPDGAPLPVGSFAPNGFGLYDMAGSMWTWCEERYDEIVPDDRARMSYDDTLIRDVRHNRICRGGSFKTSDVAALYCAHRHEDPTDSRFDCIGVLPRRTHLTCRWTRRLPTTARSAAHHRRAAPAKPTLPTVGRRGADLRGCRPTGRGASSAAVAG